LGKLVAVVALACLFVLPGISVGEEPAVVSDLKITTLSTMLTEFQGVGEWGFAALVEVDGKTILFDTGWRPETVRQNAEELGIDLSTVDTVVLSHNHADHTGGLVTLRRSQRAPRARTLSLDHRADPASSSGEELVTDCHARAGWCVG
jgi:7,8-dihydropterin-6-yl-methyl-4-(beta-D-ribofuranosyl)aminobenzene 5'-phosphate synthase